jgi:hypothetical protein
MIINSNVIENYLKHIIKVGLLTLENTSLYYKIINDKETADTIIGMNAGTPHFMFLQEVLDNQELSKCPKCGHYNDNIECPILRCDVCDHQWKIETLHADEVCLDCTAYKTDNCKQKIKKGY